MASRNAPKGRKSRVIWLAFGHRVQKLKQMSWATI
jgi:hypothetical protein